MSFFHAPSFKVRRDELPSVVSTQATEHFSMQCVACSPDGRHAAWGGITGEVHLAAFTPEQQLELLETFAPPPDELPRWWVDSLLFDDDDTLYVGLSRGFETYSLARRERTRRWPTQGGGRTLTLNAERRLLAAATWERPESCVHVFDTSAASTSDATSLPCVRTLRDHPDSGTEPLVCALSKSRWLASGGEEQFVNVYDMDSDFARRELRIEADAPSKRLVFDDGDRQLLVLCYRSIHIFSVPAFEQTHVLLYGASIQFFDATWLGRDRFAVADQYNNTLRVYLLQPGRIEQLAGWERAHGSLVAIARRGRHRELLSVGIERSVRRHRLFNLFGECDATAALFRASLRVYAALRRSRLGELVLQLIAEAAAGGDAALASLTRAERDRLFTGARVSAATRAARAGTLASLKDFHYRTEWLRESMPLYKHDELGKLGAFEK